MKLERLHESVLPTFVLIVGLLLAVYSGLLISAGATGKVGLMIAAFVAVAIALTGRQHLWVLIPATWMLTGKMQALPLPFSIAHLTVLFAFGVFLFLKAFKVIRIKPKSDFVDVWMMVVLAYLVSVYIRNPVGAEAIGSERVGGRPYFDILVAFFGCWVLSRSVATPATALMVPVFAIAGNTFSVILNFIAYTFPGVVGPLSMIYSGFEAAEMQDSKTGIVENQRKSYLLGFGSSLFLAACSFWRPLSLANPLNVGRFLIFAIAGIAVLLSGFRSAVMTMFAVALISTYFRKGWPEVIRILAVVVFCLTLLIAVQGSIVNLPFTVQRSLSFLPGKWEYAATSDAEGSTEWRVEMWRRMLTGDKYIQNKWLGDGFGFTKYQLQQMAANALTGSSTDQQENLMIGGGVHSGPISSIRYVGYVGLAIFLTLMILVALRGWRLIRRSEGTPYYHLALFIGIAAIWHPVYFVFIFGAYEVDLPNILIAIGMQKMLQNTLDAHASRESAETNKIQPIPAPRRIQDRVPLGHTTFRR